MIEHVFAIASMPCNCLFYEINNAYCNHFVKWKYIFARCLIKLIE